MNNLSSASEYGLQMAAEIIRSAQKVAEQAEVFMVSSRATPIQFEANRLRQVQTKERASVALRIFREGKIGLSTASGGDDDMEALLGMAVETSQFGLSVNFQFPSYKEFPKVSILDPEIEKMAMKKMVEFGEELIARIREHAPEILCDVEITKGTSSVYIINSQGGEACYGKSFFSLGVEGVQVRDTDMLFVGDGECSCRLPSSVDILADRVIWQLEMAKEKAAVSTGSLPVIFTPRGVASALLSPIVMALNGKTVFEGASPLKDKLGEQVFDKGISLWDDATIAYSVGSSPCDDEGMPSQRLPLVTNGVVSNFMYDLRTAASAGTQSTGNGRRAGGSFPMPAISSLILDEGEVTFEAMVKDVEEGLVVEQLIGADQGNILSGDFGGNVLLGYKIEKGRIVGRVKDTMIAGNVYQVLRELLGIGREAEWVGGILRSPALYCPRVSVTAKGN